MIKNIIFADQTTDSTVAYTKDVPSDALSPYFVNEVGGRTVVWNQAFGFTRNTSSRGVSISISGQHVIYSGTATQTSSDCVATFDYAFILNHKYLFLTTNENITIEERIVGSWKYHKNEIVTCTVENVTQFSTALSVVSGTTYNESAYINVFDLTAMFGSGNEPSTVAEFRAMFPSDYYAYSANTLLNADVVNVKSVGKNLLNTQRTTVVTSGEWGRGSKRNFTENQVWVGITRNGYFNNSNVQSYSLAEGAMTLISVDWGYGIGIPFRALPNTTYTLNCVGTNYSHGVGYYDAEGYNIGNSDSYGRAITVTTPSNTAWLLYVVYSNPINETATLSNIQIEKGSTATTYSPYTTASLPIPSAARSLCPLYGASAGSAYNYIDWDARVYHQRVASVDLGTLTWVYETSMSRFRTQSLIGTVKTYSSLGKNMVCTRFTAASTTADKTMFTNTDGTMYFYDSSYTDATAFTTALSGVYLYYELATEVTVDLSSVLTADNFIEVEAEGTITLENSHGDTYRIPVPSTETYDLND